MLLNALLSKCTVLSPRKGISSMKGISPCATIVFLLNNGTIKVKAIVFGPAWLCCWRNIITSEILRVLDSLQLTDKAKVATPVDWKMGDECMVLPTVPEESLDAMFPHGVSVVPLPSGKKYLRKTPCPNV